MARNKTILRVPMRPFEKHTKDENEISSLLDAEQNALT